MNSLLNAFDALRMFCFQYAKAFLLFAVDDSDNLVRKEKLPVGVRIPNLNTDHNKFRPPCQPQVCCRRNPISASGPQDHSKPNIRKLKINTHK